jgi:nucleotidyltransferase substrate binding protein (TIGR01987 family)
MSHEIDITSLERAIRALEAALMRHAATPADDLVRDGCIQRFEFTYELSYKMLKRFLEATSENPPEFDKMSFQNIIRTGSERDLLLNDLPRWIEYRTARGTTSHAYDEVKAKQVFAIIPAFLAEARHLRDRLREELA